MLESRADLRIASTAGSIGAERAISRQINPALAANHVQVIEDTHGETSQRSAADIDALVAYVMSLH